jgi:hypothetical protein
MNAAASSGAELVQLHHVPLAEERAAPEERRLFIPHGQP